LNDYRPLFFAIHSQTQLAIQIALDAQIPAAFNGNAGEAVYIDTEGSFMVERAAEIAESLVKHLKRISNSSASKKSNGIAIDTSTLTVEKFLSGIHVYRAHEQAELIGICNHLSAFIRLHPKVKVVIIDSIAFHFRQNLQNHSERARLLSALAQTLNQVAYDHKVAIVVTNHMAAKVEKGSSRLVPCLGEQWSHCVTNRVILSVDLSGRSHAGILAAIDPFATSTPSSSASSASGSIGMSAGCSPLDDSRAFTDSGIITLESGVRIAEIVKSASRPLAQARYRICKDGVRDIKVREKHEA
jgi:RecA/RadA recombinase